MKDIVWGMIGCGDVTEVKNGPGLYLAENSRLKAVTNRTISKACSWVMRHGHGEVYSDVEAIFNDPEIDIVYIATTPDMHMEYAIRCAEAGKHCLIEKPLALNYEEGLKIKEAFDKAGRNAYVAFYRRSLNRFNKVSELVREGTIGKLQAVNAIRYVKPVRQPEAWRMKPEISGGNIFTETEIHVLDYIYSILGEAKSCSWVKNTFDSDSREFDALSMSVMFESGVIGSGQWLYNCQTEEDRVELIGDKGIIRFEFFNNASPVYVITSSGTVEYIIKDSDNVGRNMEQEIVNELNGKGHFSGTIDAALATLKLTSDIIKSPQG